MTIRIVAASALGVAVLLMLAAPTSAQTTPAPRQSSAAAGPSAQGGDSLGDFEAGVDFYTRVPNRGVTNTYKKGWHFTASYRITHRISVTAEVSGNYQARPGYTANLYTYAGGAKFQSRTKDKKFKPFLQILLGGGQDNGTGTGKIFHYPLLAPGAGCDVALSPRVGVRVRLDFPLLMTFANTLKATRLSAGLVFPFGTR